MLLPAPVAALVIRSQGAEEEADQEQVDAVAPIARVPDWPAAGAEVTEGVKPMAQAGAAWVRENGTPKKSRVVERAPGPGLARIAISAVPLPLELMRFVVQATGEVMIQPQPAGTVMGTRRVEAKAETLAEEEPRVATHEEPFWVTVWVEMPLVMVVERGRTPV